ncbi:nitrilase-related carbon-nitrogen hydrolase [Candidatus Lucifugimonas marina]|uniref:nitrilase-related carbon-nitrogen hydrolase n=1 Tax=Candidatus Lucifugimonas marina TaxID=3038979 RepID=UPI00319E4893
MYRKRHLADNEKAFTAGSDSYLGKVGGTTFGTAVCADYEVSDEFVAASESGASIVFHSSAPGLYGERRTDNASWLAGFDWWRSSTIEKHSQRAKNLGIYIAMSTGAGATADEDFPGWSALFNPDGEIVAELPDWQAGNLIVEI